MAEDEIEGSVAPVTDAPEFVPEEISNPSWERVQLARHPKRPHSWDYIQGLTTGFEELHGDRFFGDDKSIIAGMGLFEGKPVMIVGQQKGRDTKEKLLRNFGMPKPEGYRKALRVMQLAAKFQRPVITLIDTPGAYPGIDAEERGQAEAIAYNLREMSRLRTAGDCDCDRRRGKRRRVGVGGREPRLHAGERLLQRDFARKLRSHYLPRFGESSRSSGGLADDRNGSTGDGID